MTAGRSRAEVAFSVSLLLFVFFPSTSIHTGNCFREYGVIAVNLNCRLFLLLLSFCVIKVNSMFFFALAVHECDICVYICKMYDGLDIRIPT